MNEKLQDNGKELSEAQLEKALGVLDYMNSVDIGGVKDKTLRLIVERKAGRRRKKLMSYGAAAAVVLAAVGGIWFHVNRNTTADTSISRITDNVVLTTSDGRDIVLGADVADDRIAQEDGVSVILSDGSLKYVKEDASSAPELRYSSLIVPKGNRFDIVLEDGTHVWLNADSRMQFPVEFVGDERRVFIEGEACFVVTPDAEKPFIVETADQTITVLGTEFNIYAYSGEQYTYTTLVSGSVSVKAEGGETVLMPGQQARLLNGTDDFTVRDVDAEELTSWRDGMFVFSGITLEQVFVKLSRWYDFEYRFDDSRARSLVLRGSIPIYADPDLALELIESSGLAAIERNGKHITIKMKQ